tara:strand:- start:52 stop:399 length:348 start_codon:yes stop_codon:yes gene_type:complete
MKLLKINLVDSDAFTASYGYIDTAKIVSVDGGADTVVINVGHDGTVTFTFDGTDAAEKLANVAAFLAWLAPQLVGKKDDTIFDLFGAMTIAELHTAAGLVRTGAANTALASVVIA